MKTFSQCGLAFPHYFSLSHSPVLLSDSRHGKWMRWTNIGEALFLALSAWPEAGIFIDFSRKPTLGRLHQELPSFRYASEILAACPNQIGRGLIFFSELLSTLFGAMHSHHLWTSSLEPLQVQLSLIMQPGKKINIPVKNIWYDPWDDCSRNCKQTLEARPQQIIVVNRALVQKGLRKHLKFFRAAILNFQLFAHFFFQDFRASFAQWGVTFCFAGQKSYATLTPQSSIIS